MYWLMIFRSAFGLEEAASGALGYTIAQGMINGLKRGLFSNEAGMGSAPNAAASATPYPPHPASQGYVQMLGVFMDTIVICSATVAIILMSGEYVPHGEITGIELTQRALSSQVGGWGSSLYRRGDIFFFAFTSLVANYSYAETNLIFLEHNHKAGLTVFRIVVLGDGDVRCRGGFADCVGDGRCVDGDDGNHQPDCHSAAVGHGGETGPGLQQAAVAGQSADLR